MTFRQQSDSSASASVAIKWRPIRLEDVQLATQDNVPCSGVSPL